MNPDSIPDNALAAAEPSGGGGRRIAGLLAPVFFLSGLSSLIYQVVWQRLLTLHYGVGSVSITLIVSVYMLGLGLGALLGGRLAERLRSALYAYCAVELLIAGFGSASLPLLGQLGRLTAGSSHLTASLAMFLFLVLPTLLMGATLPLLVKAFNRFERNFFRSVSLLYFVNTLGAAAGALVTAYGLISFWGLDVAVHAAAGLNVLLALAVLAIGWGGEPRGAATGQERESRVTRGEGEGLARRVYPLVFISGFLAIGYELVWFRIIGVLIKASPYAFATSLAVYLLGIALGSYAVERFLRNRPDLSRTQLFFTLQFLTGLAVLVLVAGFVRLVDAGPFAQFAARSFQKTLHPASWSPGELLGVLVWPVYFQLVPTLLIGACFPLLASLALRRPDREGATVGRVYFVNTLGNLLGGVISGFVLLEILGSERTLLCFVAVNLLLLLLAPRRVAFGVAWLRRPVLVGAALGVAALLLPGPGQLYRPLYRDPGPEFEAYLEEGVEGVVATFERGPVVINYINGLIHGGRPDLSFAMETLEALSVADSVERVLVIGFGTGTITETLLRDSQVRNVTLVELSRALLRNLGKMQVFREILADPRLEIVIDDGRRHLLRSESSYDLILMDPLRTTTAYSNNLYSVEFFELLSQRLRSCGVFMVWTDDPHVLPRTVATAFEHAALYTLPNGYGFLLGSRCTLARRGARLRRLVQGYPEPGRAWLRQQMEGLRPVLEREGVLRETEGFPINRDRRPRSEYYLGRYRAALAAWERARKGS
jgi:predicted membrane-bound spermidine synthase